MFSLKSYSNKPLLLGFIISFLGSLPLGYLNIVALQFFVESGTFSLTSFVLGIVCVEFVVLHVVSFFATWLVKQSKMLLFIDVFTIIFLMSLAIYFCAKIGQPENVNSDNLALGASPFLLGVFLNTLNVIQWPYWSGVYIYLLRSNQMSSKRWATHVFIAGALTGTATGILFFVYTVAYLLQYSKINLASYLNPIFGLTFIILTIVHGYKLYKKQLKK